MTAPPERVRTGPVALSATGPDPGAALDPAFGRCRYFLLFDGNGDIVEVVENSATSADSGAAAQAVQLLVDRGVDTVLTGRCGATATLALDAAGITTVTGLSGPADDVVRAHLGR
ncbi:MAG: NifB/NifX family molybdenum-iron cluster-binding protein [Kineosporiaceae bacterium]|jgi:predicted Fe-Mo cluster-binding NifX family protein